MNFIYILSTAEAKQDPVINAPPPKILAAAFGGAHPFEGRRKARLRIAPHLPPFRRLR